jgi:formylglycine-generating enzyme required for sulfatase activity
MTMIGVEPGYFQPFDYDWNRDGGFTIIVSRLFFLQDTEVTWLDYRKFLDSPDHPAGEKLSSVTRSVPAKDCPARFDMMSALLYCNWLSRSEGRLPCYRLDRSAPMGATCDFQANGYRLPTEAEWEQALRDGTTTRYATGDDAERLLEYGAMMGADEGGPSRTRLPNPLGLFDLHGNQWEVCWSVYPLLARGWTIAPYERSPKQCCGRGGSAAAGLFYMSASGHYPRLPQNPSGFRVVCGPEKPVAKPDDRAAAIAAVTQALNRHPPSLRACKLLESLLTASKK